MEWAKVIDDPLLQNLCVQSIRLNRAIRLGDLIAEDNVS